LLTLVMLGAAAGSQFRFRFPDVNVRLLLNPPDMDILMGGEQGAPPEEMLELAPVEHAGWGIIILLFLLLFVLSLVAYAVIRHFWSRRGRLRELTAEVVEQPAASPAPIQITRDELADMVALARARFAEARDPSDAVVAGWLAFEQFAARKGWVREPHETTTEFTARLLAASPAPPGPVATLRGLYQKVRFGGQVPTDDDVAQAQQALVDIAQSLATVKEKETSADAATSTVNTGGAYPGTVSPSTGTSSRAGGFSLARPGATSASPVVIKPGVTRNKWGED